LRALLMGLLLLLCLRVGLGLAWVIGFLVERVQLA
jgi:hypothetical protein